MNIFVLSNDPSEAAQFNCNKHVIKMTTELWQQLGSAVRRYGAEDKDMPLTKSGNPLGDAHPNHPCTLWVGKTRSNFMWAVEHAKELANQYSITYNREHYCLQGIKHLEKMANLIPDGSLTPFAQCMPEECRNTDAVIAYRNFYINIKQHVMQVEWKNRRVPEWWMQQA